MLNMDEIIRRKCVLLEAALDAIQRNKLKLIIDGDNFVFFFLYGDEVFGSNENGRVMFAKMKDPSDEDNTPGWLKEANFTGTNLNRLGQGVQQQMIFSKDDLNKINIISKDEAFSRLEAFFEGEKDGS